MKRIWKIGVQTGVVLVLVLSLAVGTNIPVSEAAIDNNVLVEFNSAVIHSASGDSVDNTALPPSWRSAMCRIANVDDGVAGPVVTPQVTFTPATGVNVESTNPSTSGPPYAWNLTSIDEGAEQTCLARITAESSNFTPGFSASRTLDKVDFSGSGVQTQTVIIQATPGEAIPGEEIDELRFMVRILPGDALVNASIVSYDPTDGGRTIKLSPDGQRLDIIIANPAIGGDGYTQEVTLNIQLKEGVSSASFKPTVSITAAHRVDSQPVEDDVVTRNTTLGEWICQTGEPYSWQWTEWQNKGVSFPGTQHNNVSAGFSTNYTYWTSGDSAENPVTDQYTSISSWLHNSPDQTGLDILGPVLNLSTTQPVISVKSEYLVPGSEYQWQFPSITPNTSSSAGASLDQKVIVNTGLDFSRTVNDSIFSPSGGTQTLTLNATPKEAMDRLEVNGNAPKVLGENVATITSVSGPGNRNIGADGRSFNIQVNDPSVDQLYQWTITVEIAPFPVEWTELDYMLNVTANNEDIPASGGVWGNNLTKDTISLGDPPNTLGTWGWTASADYAWNWEQRICKQVTLGGRATILSNQVGAGFQTTYYYRTAADFVGNTNLTGSVSMNSNLNNQDDGTNGDVLGPSSNGGPLLNLDSDQTITNVGPEGWVEPQYTWHFSPVPEKSSVGANANLAAGVVYTPGFSVTRSVDQSIFPHTGGNRTQTLTLSVTMAEAMTGLSVGGRASVDGRTDIATITGVSGPGDIGFDGQQFKLWFDKPAVGTYQWTVTIQIADPLPEEFLALEYMPEIWVGNVRHFNTGNAWGSSLTGRSLDHESNLLGTWSWTATGSYLWNWWEQLVKQVDLTGYAIHAYVTPPTQDSINQAIDDGLDWLRLQQQPDGSWLWGRPGRDGGQGEIPEAPNVGMTGLAVWSLLHGLVPQTDPAVVAGINFLLSRQDNNPDSREYGAIHTGQPTYETALAILALRATNNPIYLPVIKLAADYLARSQNDEGVEYPNSPGGCPTDHWAYGGWSYGYGGMEGTPKENPTTWTPRADLSCTQYVMIALKAAQEAGVGLTHCSWDEVWAKGQTYVLRCQYPDGGFGYQPPTAPNAGSSYGLMTAAAVWCLRLSGLPTSDPYVQDGLAWLDLNPFYDRSPLNNPYHHYFLWAAAKAFSICDRPPQLVEGTWYYDYAGYLLGYRENGHWESPLWPEGESPVNATGYALLVLEKAVLPPPPGIKSIAIDHMRIEFDPRPNSDKIKILQARFQLDAGASYDLAKDDVIVDVDGVVITIPAGSFKHAGTGNKYHYASTQLSTDGSTYKLIMDLDFDTGQWSLTVHDIDATPVDSDNGVPVVGVDVTLMIGYMLAGTNVPMWIDYLVFPPTPPVK